ncbi:MAG: tRNA preQ1(34) S-adenosylmethionine ribosyltransferase-isomerase QueA [bacterium]|nr:tRNA preQ1(34) S-adenosylmethionine ribosyltransferase-isomerase QueA [bacterium]
MNVSDFDYDVPEERIAQRPTAERSDSRLLTLDRDSGHVAHRRFAAITELLRPGDLLVVNDTRVLPARLFGRKPSGGRVELLLLSAREAPDEWDCLIRASHPPAPGARVELGEGLVGEIVARDEETWRVRLEAREGEVAERIEHLGHMPLPPYIKRDAEAAPAAEDRERYQTVFARRSGAVAAPTAGLHFSEELLERVTERGVELARLTLHVGLGTFRPVRVERVEEHRMHSERFDLPPALAEAIERTRARGGRVVATGTTVVRVLEHRARGEGRVDPGDGSCALFITPGFRFRVVDALITNFHLPRSTLLMLVSAFAGREPLLAAYREAVEREYRFFSYGDAMFIGDCP